MQIGVHFVHLLFTVTWIVGQLSKRRSGIGYTWFDFGAFWFVFGIFWFDFILQMGKAKRKTTTFQDLHNKSPRSRSKLAEMLNAKKIKKEKKKKERRGSAHEGEKYNQWDENAMAKGKGLQLMCCVSAGMGWDDVQMVKFCFLFFAALDCVAQQKVKGFVGLKMTLRQIHRMYLDPNGKKWWSTFYKRATGKIKGYGAGVASGGRGKPKVLNKSVEGKLFE